MWRPGGGLLAQIRLADCRITGRSRGNGRYVHGFVLTRGYVLLMHAPRKLAEHRREAFNGFRRLIRSFRKLSGASFYGLSRNWCKELRMLLNGLVPHQQFKGEWALQVTSYCDYPVWRRRVTCNLLKLLKRYLFHCQTRCICWTKVFTICDLWFIKFRS